MSSTPQQDLRKVSIGRARPAATAIQTSASPHTPLSRSISSLYGSPTASFRIEEDNLLIFEFGARCMRAGFAGESAPRCLVAYSPEQQRRVGDYRQWLPGCDTRSRKRKRGKSWASDYELWRMNIEDVDLGLVEDKIERLLREVEHQYLMLDNRQKKVALVVSSLLPKPLLSILVGSVFSTLQASTVTLLPSSVMAAVGAGLRSALVVDIGWEETSVNAVYEYREIMQWRSIRGGKMLSEAFAKLFEEYADATLAFEELEDITTRVGWCRQRGSSQPSTGVSSDDIIEIPLPTATLGVPFAKLADPVEEALFAHGAPTADIDDHDRPLPQLIYNALLHLPIDIRQLCVSRLVFTGGVSNLPGLKSRLTQEVEALVRTRGWDPVKNYGSVQGIRERKVLARGNGNAGQSRSAADADAVRHNGHPTTKVSESTEEEPGDVPYDIPAYLREPEPDPIIDRISQHTSQGNSGVASQGPGAVRAIETLGAWAGASLVTTLRVRGIVEIEKDRFLQHGLAGGIAAKKDISVVQSRQSFGPGVKAGAGERSSWTLGIWA